jgi:geranylgeranyl diphosphate synthase type II
MIRESARSNRSLAPDHCRPHPHTHPLTRCVIEEAEMTAPRTPDSLSRYLDECQELVLDEIRSFMPSDTERTGGLYELMLDYPLRGGKGLRPALCIATSRALGGSVSAVTRTAAVLELYHNAFLIHDDVEDGSELRRQRETLHRLHGVPIAVNVGDGMLAMTLRPLLDNTRLIGLGPALRILEAISEMARESAEGQMIELDWIRRTQSDLKDREYFRMVHKKSAWYSFVTPVTVGAIAAGADRRLIAKLRRFATLLGVAFQIQDDVLNLAGDETLYGKEIDGDLWEGKYSLILIHALRHATRCERERALRILRKRREGARQEYERALKVSGLMGQLEQDGELSARGREQLQAALGGDCADADSKSPADIRYLRDLIERRGSLDHARHAARIRSERAQRTLEEIGRSLPRSNHLLFLEDVVAYVVTRNR